MKYLLVVLLCFTSMLGASQEEVLEKKTFVQRDQAVTIDLFGLLPYRGAFNFAYERRIKKRKSIQFEAQYHYVERRTYSYEDHYEYSKAGIASGNFKISTAMKFYVLGDPYSKKHEGIFIAPALAFSRGAYTVKQENCPFIQDPGTTFPIIENCTGGLENFFDKEIWRVGSSVRAGYQVLQNSGLTFEFYVAPGVQYSDVTVTDGSFFEFFDPENEPLYYEPPFKKAMRNFFRPEHKGRPTDRFMFTFDVGFKLGYAF